MTTESSRGWRSREGWFRRLFGGGRATPAVTRVGISTLDPVAEANAWRSIGDRMLEIEQSMTESVYDLRADLADARGSVAGFRPPFSGASLPSHSADVIGEAVALKLSVTSLHEQLDALWFERQWLAAQLAVARGEVPMPGRGRS